MWLSYHNCNNKLYSSDILLLVACLCVFVSYSLFLQKIKNNMAKNINRKVTIYLNGKEVENSIENVRKKIRDLRKEQAKAVIGSEDYIRTTKEIRQLDKVIAKHNRELGRTDSLWDCIIKKMGDVGNTLSGLSVINDIYSGGVDTLRSLVEDAAQLDDTYADVMKTTGLTKDSVESLNKAFQKIDTRTSREELNKLAYEAGKLGISSEEDVLKFVKAADKINVALGDVLGDDAMVQIGKLSMIYKDSTVMMQGQDLEKQMLAIGSAVNMLGQSSTANEAYMIDFMGRLGGIAVQAGLSADQILGFASALDQDMQKVEMSATAFQKLIQMMIQKPEQFAETAGKSVKDFSNLIKTDMNEAVMSVLKGFQGKNGYDELVLLFKDLGLDGARAAQAISSLTNSIDEINTAQAIANKEIAMGASVVREFEVKNNSLQAQMEKAQKSFQDVRIELGQQLYPIIINMTKSSTTGIRLLNATITAVKENKTSFGLLAGALLALTAARLKSVAMAKLENSWLAKLTPSRLIETIQTNNQARAEAKLTLVRAKSELATTKQRIATYKKIIADKAEWQRKGAVGLVLTAENQLRLLNSKVIVQQTAVTKAHAAAMKATPWGAMLAGVMALTAGIVKLVTSSAKFKLNKELSEASKEMGRTTAKSNYLFDKLQKLTSGTDEYKKVLGQLNDLYPEIIGKYTDEEGKLKDIAKARREVTDAIKENIYEKARENQLSEHAENLVAKQEKIYNKVRKIIAGTVNKSDAVNADDMTSDIIADIMKNLENKDIGNSRDRYEAVSKAIENSQWMQRRTARANIVPELIEYVEAIANYNKATEEINSRIDAIIGKEKETVVVENEETEEEKQKKKEAAEEAARVAKERVEKIKSAVEGIKNVIASMNNDTLPQMQKNFADIEAEAEKVKKQLLQAYGVGDANGLNDEGKKLFADLDSAVLAKKAKVFRDIIEKTNNEADKLNNRLSGQSSNEFLEKANSEIAKFKESIADVVTKIDELNEKRAFLSAELETATGDEKKSLEGFVSEIDEALKKWDGVKKTIADSAFEGLSLSVGDSNFHAENRDRFSSVFTDSEYSDKIAEITAKYNEMVTAYEQIITAKQALSGTEGISDKRRKEIEEEIEALKHQREELEATRDVQLKMAEEDHFGKMFDSLIERIQTFGDLIVGLFDNIHSLLSNIEDSELQRLENAKNENIERLDEQLEAGIVSEEEYKKKKEALDAEYDEKQKAIQLQQFEREKALAIVEATMAAAMAILRVWSDAGNGSVTARAVQSALVAASTGVQIAAIANQPKPFARGGYVDEKTYFMAGEAGKEWIASNALLRDSKTAPVIEALEKYQRGNRSALEMIGFPRINYQGAKSAVESRAERAMVIESHNRDMAKTLADLAVYLKDPRNRQAVISRKTMIDFESNEAFLRNVAKM